MGKLRIASLPGSARQTEPEHLAARVSTTRQGVMATKDSEPDVVPQLGDAVRMDGVQFRAAGWLALGLRRLPVQRRCPVLEDDVMVMGYLGAQCGTQEKLTRISRIAIDLLLHLSLDRARVSSAFWSAKFEPVGIELSHVAPES